MNNNNSDDFLKGFSAVDSEDRIDRIDPTKEDPNRPEPTFGDRSISNNLEMMMALQSLHFVRVIILRITILKTIFR